MSFYRKTFVLVLSYLIVASPTESDGGYDLVVYRRNSGGSQSTISPKSICLNNKQKPHLTIYSEFNQSFAGLVGDNLLADNGTGPDSSQLKIYNLKTKNYYSVTYHQAFGVTNNRYLTYPQYVDKKIPLRQCANAKKWQKDGFGITWVRKVKLDLHTLKETLIGKVYCEATQ